MKISVIVPVYRVEAYLRQCVDSVLGQTYRDLEVILVDDGSPDDCPRICDEYAQKDERVRVIHKENGGLSDARNAGIRCATGDYLVFLDADDFWERRDAMEQIAARLCQTGADVLNYQYRKYYEQDPSAGADAPAGPGTMPTALHSKDEQLAYLFRHHLYIASACNKAIRRSMFNDTMLFDKGRTSEDIVWCMKLLQQAKSMDYLDLVFYCYRQHAASITHTIDLKNCTDLADNIETCVSLMKNDPYERQYIAYQLATFVKVQSFVKEYPKSNIAQMARHKGILKSHGGQRKVKLIFLASRMIGYGALCRLVRALKY